MDSLLFSSQVANIKTIQRIQNNGTSHLTLPVLQKNQFIFRSTNLYTPSQVSIKLHLERDYHALVVSSNAPAPGSF
jgi:hypothetical protein